MKSPNKIVLTADQEKANNAFLDFLVSDENFFVIQGAAGTGKSFLIKHLLETFYSKYSAYCLLLQKDVEEFDIKVTATTNKAVTVIEEFLRGANLKKDPDVSTIFSLLGLRVENDYKTGKTSLSFNSAKPSSVFLSDKRPLIFIDEASFIGADLQEIINSVLKDQAKAKVVYIGDKYQLAPVGQTVSVMEDLQCSKVSLDKIIRNSGHILATGTQFRETVETGIFNPISYNKSDVVHVKGSGFQAMIETAFSDPHWVPNKSKILAWTNDQVQAYNRHVREYLKLPEMFQVGETAITNAYIKGGRSYSRSVDSEVLITRVSHQQESCFDIPGYVVELDNQFAAFMPANYAHAKALMKTLAKKKEWKKFFEIKETWLDLRAVYASSIHKAQGSTYETVFLDLPDIGKNWNAADVARLLYVGITRSSKQVVCYGYLPDKYC